jgi:hypothetical protein
MLAAMKAVRIPTLGPVEAIELTVPEDDDTTAGANDDTGLPPALTGEQAEGLARRVAG